MTAYDGNNWVAAWSRASERFGQLVALKPLREFIMPMLPCGKHFAFKAESLAKLFEEAIMESRFVHKLMAIEKQVHLFPFIDVLYFKENEKITK